MMISLQASLLLSMGIALAVASDLDCQNCKFYNGIGFVSIDGCAVYKMCFRNPYQSDYYRSQVMCCAEGLAFDADHLTCERNPKCPSDRTVCPNATTTTDLPCPFAAVSGEPDKYKYVRTHEVMECAYGSEWDQEVCTCIFKGPYKAPCDKILDYNFNGTFDSHSCYNFAVGEKYGNPTVTNEMLCLDGRFDFLIIPYLTNWFAWNPIGRTFTLCFWFRGTRNQNAGLLSTNCYYESGGSVAEFWLENGELWVKLGELKINTNVQHVADWSKACVVFNNGFYTVYVDGIEVADHFIPSRLASNSHSATTVGYVHERNLFYGYIDDVCFWTSVRSAAQIYECFQAGPSNPEANL